MPKQLNCFIGAAKGATQMTQRKEAPKKDFNV